MEIFPNWTLVPIIFFLIVLTFILNRMFFRPMEKTLAERDRRIEGARMEAEQIRRASQEKGLEFDRRLREARREADQQIAGVKRAALGEKDQVVSQQRAQTDKMLGEAKAEVRTKVEDARLKLEEQSKIFAAEIASRILRRPIQGQNPSRA